MAAAERETLNSTNIDASGSFIPANPMPSSADYITSSALQKQDAMAFWQFLFLMMLRNTLGVDYVTHKLFKSSPPNSKMKSRVEANEIMDHENMPELASD